MGGGWFRAGTIGGDAVMVFFVLSGFVIAYVSSTKETTFKEYAAARLARLWSVLLPALIITYFVDWYGLTIAPQAYQGWGAWLAADGSPLRLLVSALFVNELWHDSIVPLSNGPVWSIGFEFWYYVIFAAIIFPSKFRLALPLAAMIIAGPRILLLFPVWLMGVVAYHVGSRWPARSSLGISVFCLSLSLLAGCYVLKLNYMLSDVNLRLLGGSIDDWRYADKFLWSYLCGLLIAAAFVGAWASQDIILRFIKPFSSAIRRGAGLTLSIYLFHHPFMLATSATLDSMAKGPARSALTILITLMLSCLFGLVFEQQRYPLRQLLLRALGNDHRN
jgi:peptidoglycan/LPS O-acetylase OafA/YrhL